MPGALIERPKMTRSMYQALKEHIMRERQRKKQEQEQDEALERRKKELEMKKKKEQEDSLTLEQTKEQIAQLSCKLEGLKAEKHELFSQLKKVLHQEDESRKRAQMREQNELMSLSAQQYHHPTMTYMQQPRGVYAAKRPRSPSPPPSTQYHSMSGPAVKYQTLTYATASDSKQPYQPHKSKTHVSYVTQSAHTYPHTGHAQPTSQQQSQQSTTSYVQSQAQGNKYPPSSSAFASYPSHYAAHQQTKVQEGHPPGHAQAHFPAGYQVQRMPQPSGAYLNSPRAGSSIPLQQQLEHANKKSGFNEEKFKLQQIRGVTASMTPQMIAQMQQTQHPSPAPSSGSASSSQPTKGGSIMSGYPVRTQATVSGFPPTSSQSIYTTQQQSQARHSYPGQHPGRYNY